MQRPVVVGGRPVLTTPVPMVKPELPNVDDDLLSGITAIITSGQLTKGRYLRELEQALAERIGVPHVVGVSSCTLALMLMCRQLPKHSEVIVPSFTFMATVHPLQWCGLKPVFVDVDEHTWNINPSCVNAAVTEQTSAIIAVHQFGNPCDVDALAEVAARHDLRLLFDAAHGMGASYRDRPLGAFGTAEAFSLSPTKLLVAGEGGVVATTDESLAEQIRLGREYGNGGDYNSAFPGLNSRMPEINALLALRGLENLTAATTRRRQIAEAIRDRLSGLPGLTFQAINPDGQSSYKDLGVVVDPRQFGLSRHALAEGLRAEGIDTRTYYDPPVHRHEAYRDVVSDALPVTEQLANNILHLPISSTFDDEIVDGICEAVERIHIHRDAILRRPDIDDVLVRHGTMAGVR